ncbi:MAG: hypothetical protein ISS23_00700 [Nanoarchaeota archaeon]|nr:hypothetical protein [Nanoarchaeota archaeon]
MGSETTYRTDGYYQAIIQIRPKDKEILTYVRKKIKEKKGVHISKEIFYKYGIDIYVTDQKFARNLGQKLKKAFKGELKITKSIHTKDRQTSKEVYRGTILFRREQKD